jgi:hypothetical protein
LKTKEQPTASDQETLKTCQQQLTNKYNDLKTRELSTKRKETYTLLKKWKQKTSI